jgi:putative peptidoglycan lipid II flippase
MLVAKIIALILVFLVIVFKSKLKISINFEKNVSTIKFIKVAFPYFSANLVTNIATFIFNYIASGFSAGVLTSLSYAQRIFSIPASLVIGPVLEIARTRFSEAQIQKDKQIFFSRYRKLIQFVIYTTIPIAVSFYSFSQEIVSVLFERGEFGLNNVLISASCLKILALSLPFYCVFMVNGRACESFQRLTWISIFGSVGNISLIVITFLLIGSYGYLGIPYARLIIDLLYFFPFGFIALRILHGKLELNLLFTSTMLALLTALISILICLSFWWGFSAPGFPPSFFSMLLLAVGYFSVYGILIFVGVSVIQLFSKSS